MTKWNRQLSTTASGTVWRGIRTPGGPATLRLESRPGDGVVLASAWGSGAAWTLDSLPAMLGAVPADAVKWIFALAFIAGSVGAYLWARRRLLDGWPALVAASAYVFSPLWLTVVYTRGALAEAVLTWLRHTDAAWKV